MLDLRFRHVLHHCLPNLYAEHAMLKPFLKHRAGLQYGRSATENLGVETDRLDRLVNMH